MIAVEASRQFECLSAIRAHLRAYQESPTRSELGRKLGITRISAHLLVKKLQAQGLVSIVGAGWRNVQLTERGWRVGPSFFSIEHQIQRREA